MAAKKKQTKSKSQVGKVKEPVVEEPKTVTIETADGRTLYVNINGRAFEGKIIEVPASLEGEVRRLLVEGNFLIK